MSVPNRSELPTESSLKKGKSNLLEIASTSITSTIPDDVLKAALLEPPFVPIPGALNLRDLGLIPSAKLKPGLLYRSGALSSLPPTSVTSLSTELKLKTIFDFRQTRERVQNPDPLIRDIETIWLPSTELPPRANPADFAEDGGVQGYCKMYDDVLKVYAQPYKTVLEYLRDKQGEPILFHCSAGKDRTGVLSALILSFTGHTFEDIANDYQLTRIGVEAERGMLTKGLTMWLGEDAMEQKGVFELSSTSTNVMMGFLKFVDEKYGGAVGYCKNILGFTDGDLEKIRQNVMA